MPQPRRAQEAHLRFYRAYLYIDYRSRHNSPRRARRVRDVILAESHIQTSDRIRIRSLGTVCARLLCRVGRRRQVTELGFDRTDSPYFLSSRGILSSNSDGNHCFWRATHVRTRGLPVLVARGTHSGVPFGFYRVLGCETAAYKAPSCYRTHPSRQCCLVWR